MNESVTEHTVNSLSYLHISSWLIIIVIISYLGVHTYLLNLYMTKPANREINRNPVTTAVMIAISAVPVNITIFITSTYLAICMYFN